jgi:hypothetical protein
MSEAVSGFELTLEQLDGYEGQGLSFRTLATSSAPSNAP